MRKKILIAESSDAIRNIAESILHQYGYDVISATSAEKAKELIISGKPNLLVIDADIKSADGQYLYEEISENPGTKSIPLLLINSTEKNDLPYPEEVILPRPFEPDNFIERVRLFVGEGDAAPKETISENKPITDDAVDDDFIDSALGLDKIEVEESEEVAKTEITGKIPVQKKEKKKDLFEIARPLDNDDNISDDDSGRVESLMIRETDSGKLQTDSPKPEDATASSKIELANDQYGLTNPEEIEPPGPKESEKAEPRGSHDYDWFIKEMQKESSTGSKEQNIQKTGPGDKNLEMRPNSDGMETVRTDGQQKEPDFQPGMGAASDEPEISAGGVEKFISEFKKEIQQMETSAEKEPSASVTSGDNKPGIDKTDLDPAELRRIAGYMVEMLAEKLAKKMVERIDKEDIYLILKNDLEQFLAKR
jgi:CheY-like chemotaxis protein